MEKLERGGKTDVPQHESGNTHLRPNARWTAPSRPDACSPPRLRLTFIDKQLMLLKGIVDKEFKVFDDIIERIFARPRHEVADQG
jgi:hypothetical protein